MHKFSRTLRAVCAVGCLTLLGVTALANGPLFWEISSPSEVLKGDARGVSIAENGSIMLAPAFALVYDSKEAYIWSSASDGAGNLYLGTGHEGRIFKVEPNGSGKLLYDSNELDVYAMVTDAAGNLYAGTSPDGKIYKITASGNATVFYDPPDKYIWSLAFDAASSILYAGTGDKGVIYKIDASGKAAVLTDTNESNITALALDKSRNLLAGTDPSGLVLRVSADGKTFALLDTPLQEVHALTVAADGSLFALGISQTAAAQKSSSLGVSSTTSISSEGVITLSSDAPDTPLVVQADSGGTTGAAGSAADGAKSAIFHLLVDGSHDVRWTSNDTAFSMHIQADGQLLVGTSNKGRIYSVAANRAQTLLLQSPEDQTSTLIAAGNQLYATSSNLGRLYRIGQQSVSEGVYTSAVRDTKFAGQWGAINWRSAGTVEIQTRTGNTESPDSTWSEWSPAYRNSAAEQITSPRARFIQWRATLRAGGQRAARLQGVTLAYLPRNQAPEVGALSALPTGVALQEMPLVVDPAITASGLDPQLFGLVASVPPRRYYQKGARTLTWQASDANGDSLAYKLFYRTLEEDQWHVLADKLSQNYYTMDANRLPDGEYLFRVEASDAPSNPAILALVKTTDTEVVEIDNTPPTVKAGEPTSAGQAVEILFEVTDVTSRIIKGEYSVDGGDWQLIYPVDGIADSAKESFKVRVTFDKTGAHVIAFRCADSNLNFGTSKVQVTR